MTMHTYHSSSGHIDLELLLSDARKGSHPGRCDDDIAALRTRPYIKSQLASIDAEELRDELREYGAWDDEQLSDHDANLNRILWLACGDIVEEGN